MSQLVLLMLPTTTWMGRHADHATPSVPHAQVEATLNAPLVLRESTQWKGQTLV